MTIRLITTSDAAGPRAHDLRRLLASVEANAAVAREPIRMHLLLQNQPADVPAGTFPAWCTVSTIGGRCSLSAARNHVLRPLLRDGLVADADLIGFPDDDCWLPSHVLGHVVDVFRRRADLGVFLCRCSLSPDDDAAAPPIRRATVPQIVRLSSSNTGFYRGHVLKAAGLFDESLGLGTSIGGSEDTDFVIRASFVAGETGFVDRALVGHAAPSRDSAVRYFRGSLVVLARHAHRSPGLALELARKLCVGMVFAARRRMTFAALAESAWLAARQRIGRPARGPT